jgi:serine protease Do
MKNYRLFAEIRIRLTVALTAALTAALGFAVLVPAASAQLTPQQREELRKKVEEQFKKEAKPAPLSGDKMQKLMQELEKRTNSQLRPVESRSEPSPRAFRKMSPKILAAFREVVAPLHRSTVRVLSNGKDASLGTVIGANGWILTKASELKGKVTCKFSDGRELPARIIGVHEDTDLAMLKVEAHDLAPVAFSKATPQVGDWVVTSGMSADPTSIGVVSVQPRRVMAPRGMLGIGLEQGDGGARIREVMPGSGAAKAGLKLGDTVLSINGKQAKTHEDLVAIVAHYKPGDVLTLTIRRDGKEVTVQATLGGMQQDSRSNMQNTMGGPISERRSNFTKVLQHDSVLKPTECGGPLADLDGHVIGINIARAGRVESYAIPSEVVASITAELKSGELMPAPPVAEYEKKLAEAMASLQKAEASVKEVKGQLDKVVGEAQDALKKVENARSATQKAVQEAQSALEKARAEEHKQAIEDFRKSADK